MSLLQDLRKQMYVAASVRFDLKTELVADFLGEELVPKSSWQGWIVRTLGKDHQIQDELIDVLNVCRRRFHEAIHHLQSHNTAYYRQIKNILENQAVDLHQMDKSLDGILQFCMHLNPFIKQFLKDLSLPYIVFFKEGLDRDNFLTQLRLAKLVQKMQNMEIVTSAKIPVPILFQIASGKTIQASEERKITDWLKAIEDSASKKVATFRGDKTNPYVKVHYFHRFLSKLVKEFAALCPHKSLSCALLELKLKEMGCLIFSQEDPFWIRKRQKMAPGDVVDLVKGSYIIREVLFNPDNKPDLPMVFSLENSPDYVIHIEKNEAERSFARYIEGKEQYGLLLPQDVDGDLTGAIALVENCQDLLSEITWESKGMLCNEDIVNAQPIIALLTGMQKQPFTPFPLSPDYFAFNGSDELRAVHRMTMGVKSFEAIEKFAWQCALDEEKELNPLIFSHLMHASGLADSRYVLEYHELLQVVLEGKNKEESISKGGEIEREDILLARKRFYEEAHTMHIALIDEIKKVYQIRDERKFHKVLKEKMLQLHQAYYLGSLFLPDFARRVKNSLLGQLMPRMHMDQLLRLEGSLIDKIARSNSKKDPEILNSIFQSKGIYHLDQINYVLSKSSHS